MTTAMLSVGIDTSPAKQNLADLKSWLANDIEKGLEIKGTFNGQTVARALRDSLRNVKFGINATITKKQKGELKYEIENAISGAFNQPHRILSWSQSSLIGSLDAALRSAFETNHDVHVNTTGLTDSIRLAVQAGMSGHTVGVLAMQQATTSTPVHSTQLSVEHIQALQTTMARLLNKPVEQLVLAADELTKSAALVGGTLKKVPKITDVDQTIGIGEPSKARANISESTKLSDGSTLRYSIPHDEPDTAKNQIRSLNTINNATEESLKNQLGLNQMYGKQARAQAAGDLLKQTEEYQAGLRAQRDATEESLKNQLGLNQMYGKQARAQAAGDLLKQTEEYQAGLRAQRNTTEESLKNQLGLNQMYGKQARAQAAGDLLKQTEEYQAGLRAKAKVTKDANDSQQLEMARFYKDAQIEASKTHTGTGANIIASVALGKKYGGDAADAHLGSNAVFRTMASDADLYIKKVAAATAETHSFKGAMNEAHSAARGLAGSMGAMWLTWGSIIPLAAGAALGAAMRSVFTEGKAVEYQLAFVSALSDNAVVSIERFNNAIAGSMVGPLEAAKAMRGLAQNGLSVAQALSALPSILALATAGEMDLNQAALGATGVMAAFGLQVNDLGHIGDVFAKAAATSNTSVQSMVESMKQASVVGDEFHVSLENTAATLATLAKRNITGTAAGTAFRNMMTELAAPSKKARDAMSQLHIELYDGNKQLIPYQQMLGKLKDAVSGLSEKSKIAFLGDMFGERGAKAVSALLSDFDILKNSIEAVNTESNNFTASIIEALGETTQGKIQKLFSEFHVAAKDAFEGANSAFGKFTDDIRLWVTSDEFKKGLSSITEGVITFTKVIMDNGKVIEYAIIGILGYKVAIAATNAAVAIFGMSSLVYAPVAIAVAALALTVGALYAAYKLLTPTIDAKTDAMVAETNAIKLLNQASEQRGRNADIENEILERQTRIMWSGVDAIKARKQAEGDVKKVKHIDLESSYNSSNNEYQRLKKLKEDTQSTKGSGLNIQFTDADQAAYVAAYKNKNVLRDALEQSAATQIRTEQSDKSGQVQGAIEAWQKLNNSITDFNANKENVRLHVSITPLSKEGMLTSDGDIDPTWGARMAAKESERSKKGQNYTQHAAKGGNGDPILMQELAALEKSWAEKRKIEDAGYRAAENVLKTREKYKLDTLSVSEGMQTELMRTHEATRLKMANDEIIGLESIRVKINADKSKATTPEAKEAWQAKSNNINSLIKSARFHAEEVKTTIDGLIQESQYKLEGAKKKVLDDFDDVQFKAVERNLFAIIELNKKAAEFTNKLSNTPGSHAERSMYGSEYINSLKPLNLNKVNAHAIDLHHQAIREANFQNSLSKGFNKTDTLSGAKDASVKAGMDAYREGQSEIVALKAKEHVIVREMAVEEANRIALATMRLDPERQLTALQELQYKSLVDGIPVRQEELEVARKQVEAAEAQRDISAKARSEAATKNYNAAITPKAGMTSFWTNYTKQAADSAATVNAIMSQSFASLEQGMLKFVTTGKLNFGDLARSILADMVKLEASQLFRKMMSRAGGAFMDLLKGGTSASSGGGVTGSVISDIISMFMTTSANGNVMTSRGPMTLGKYANGGIASSPQLSLFGEGSTPEAYVPLPDGRSIPVSMSGGGGGTSVSLTYNPIIHIDSRTDQAQVGQLVSNAVKEGNKQMMQQLRDSGAIA